MRWTHHKRDVEDEQPTTQAHASRFTPQPPPHPISSHPKRSKSTQEETRAHLADVQIVTLIVQLGVVDVEHGRVDFVSGGDAFAGVAGLDNVGVLAVGTGRAETELVTDLEVGTSLVDLAVVDDGELVAALFCIQRMGHC